MIQIDSITAEYRQRMQLSITNYGYATLTISFKPNQLGWFFDLEWQDFSVYNQKLTMAPNILRQYRKILPFGLMCINTTGIDPLVLESFVLDTKLYLMDSAEVVAVEAAIYGD
jgi:hypothetical protein